MNVLDEANELVNGVRQEKYGHPSDNHGATAEMWTTYLKRRGLLAEGAVLDGHDVCVINILQKTTRDANVRQRDNLVDIAGFALNAEMVDEAVAEDPPKAGVESFVVAVKKQLNTPPIVPPPVTERTIQLVTMGGERRFEKPVRTKPRQKFVNWGCPVEFPLGCTDQFDDIIKAIGRERAENFHDPECLFLPARKEGDEIFGLKIWGIPVEIDKTLGKDEFVLRAYRRNANIIEFRHYRFSEGKID